MQRKQLGTIDRCFGNHNEMVSCTNAKQRAFLFGFFIFQKLLASTQRTGFTLTRNKHETNWHCKKTHTSEKKSNKRWCCCDKAVRLGGWRVCDHRAWELPRYCGPSALWTKSNYHLAADCSTTHWKRTSRFPRILESLTINVHPNWRIVMDTIFGLSVQFVLSLNHFWNFLRFQTRCCIILD